MSDKNTKKVDCNAPRTSPLFSWALCGMTGREKSEGKPRNIKTSPMTVPDMNKGFKPIKKQGGRRRKRKTRRKRKSRRRRKTRVFKKHYMWNTKGKRYLAKTKKQHMKGKKLGHTHVKPKRKSRRRRK